MTVRGMTPCSSFRAVMFVIWNCQGISSLTFIDGHIVEKISSGPPPQAIASFIVIPVDVNSRHVRDCVWIITSLPYSTLK